MLVQYSSILDECSAQLRREGEYQAVRTQQWTHHDNIDRMYTASSRGLPELLGHIDELLAIELLELSDGSFVNRANEEAYETLIPNDFKERWWLACGGEGRAEGIVGVLLAFWRKNNAV